jgi:tRNA dimethylallyltransferase
MAKNRVLIAIVGPTAVGKTTTALSLAQLIGGEIVSADSRLLYDGMNIGTAKPNCSEMQRIPHHLIDVTTPDKPWTLAQYKIAATDAISDIQLRGCIPLLVGGTGQYVRAIIEGWDIPPLPEDSRIREDLTSYLECYGSVLLHEKLIELDCEAAESIDHRNTRRVIRALEVCISTGRTFSEQRTKTKPNYDVLTFGLTMERSDLYARIDERIDNMFDNGWVEEVYGLLDKGYTWDMPSMSALGYPEVGSFIREEFDLMETKRRIRRISRKLVRRQYSWFSMNDTSIDWYEMKCMSLAELYTVAVSWMNSIP